jgi:hypothetical protein
VSKNSKHWSNENGPSSTTKIVQRNNSERSTATSQCIWIQIFIFVPRFHGIFCPNFYFVYRDSTSNLGSACENLGDLGPLVWP